MVAKNENKEKFVWWCTFLFHFENTEGVILVNADKFVVCNCNVVNVRDY